MFENLFAKVKDACRTRTLVAVLALAAGTGGFIVGTGSADAGPIGGGGCGPANPCGEPDPLPEPEPAPDAAGYCCTSVRFSRDRAGKVSSITGSGCRSVAEGQNCGGLENRVQCNGWVVETLLGGDLNCSN
jgi:hypothetical protein